MVWSVQPPLLYGKKGNKVATPWLEAEAHIVLGLLTTMSSPASYIFVFGDSLHSGFGSCPRDSIPQNYNHSSLELPPVSQLLHSTLDIALPLRAPYGPTTFNKNPGVLTAFCLVIRRADRDLRLCVQHLCPYCWDRSAGQVESAPQSVRGVMMI